MPGEEEKEGKFPEGRELEHKAPEEAPAFPEGALYSEARRIYKGLAPKSAALGVAEDKLPPVLQGMRATLRKNGMLSPGEEKKGSREGESKERETKRPESKEAWGVVIREVLSAANKHFSPEAKQEEGMGGPAHTIWKSLQPGGEFEKYLVTHCEHKEFPIFLEKLTGYFCKVELLASAQGTPAIRALFLNAFPEGALGDLLCFPGTQTRLDAALDGMLVDPKDKYLYAAIESFIEAWVLKLSPAFVSEGNQVHLAVGLRHAISLITEEEAIKKDPFYKVSRHDIPTPVLWEIRAAFYQAIGKAIAGRRPECERHLHTIGRAMQFPYLSEKDKQKNEYKEYKESATLAPHARKVLVDTYGIDPNQYIDFNYEEGKEEYIFLLEAVKEEFKNNEDSIRIQGISLPSGITYADYFTRGGREKIRGAIARDEAGARFLMVGVLGEGSQFGGMPNLERKLQEEGSPPFQLKEAIQAGASFETIQDIASHCSEDAAAAISFQDREKRMQDTCKLAEKIACRPDAVAILAILKGKGFFKARDSAVGIVGYLALGNELLVAAAYAENTPLLEALCQAGEFPIDYAFRSYAPRHRFAIHGQSALQIAVRRGNVAYVKRLMDAAHGPGLKNVLMQKERGTSRTLLMLAAQHNHPEIIPLLMDGGIKIDIDAVDAEGSTALMLATVRGYKEVVKQLLDRGANADLKDVQGDTALMIAARLGHIATVEMLLKYWANVELVNDKGEDALVLARAKGHGAVVKLLEERQKIMDFRRAVQNGHVTLVEEAINQGIDLDLQDNHGLTALMVAAHYGHHHVVDMLLIHGANADLQDKQGDTALMIAVRYGYYDVVEKLLGWEAGMDLQNGQGDTALTIAQRNGRYTIVKLLEEKKKAIAIEIFLQVAEDGHIGRMGRLLEGGGDVNVQDDDGQTALMKAAGNGHVSMVKLLLGKGASMDLQNGQGDTALTIARENGQLGVVALLMGQQAVIALAAGNSHAEVKGEIEVPADRVVSEKLKRVALVKQAMAAQRAEEEEVPKGDDHKASWQEKVTRTRPSSPPQPHV